MMMVDGFISEKNPSLLFQSPVFDLFIHSILIPWAAFVALYTVDCQPTNHDIFITLAKNFFRLNLTNFFFS